MRRRWWAIGLVIAVTALMMGVLACSSTNNTGVSTPSTSGQTPSGAAQSAVAVNLVEYKVAPQPPSVPSGNVTFEAKNIGGTDHELVVIKTNLAQGALPTKGDGSVNETSSTITIVGKTASIPKVQAKSVTLNLAPGDYVLICNLVQTTNGTTTSHYAQGMHAGFTVTP